MKKRIINALLLCGIAFVSCDKCEDETKRFNAELYPTIRSSFYDWQKVNHVSGDTIYFGIGTEYLTCGAKGQEELKSESLEFYTDRQIVMASDTIHSMVNLLNESSLVPYITFYKEIDAFFNSPQYLIRIDNETLNLNEYYTFYFKGFTVSGAEINDSTIVYAE